MAVVTRYGQAYPQFNAGTGYQTPDSRYSRATVKSLLFNIAAVNGDSIGSVYRLGRLPSNAILLGQDNIAYSAAIAGLTSVSVGLDNLLGTTAPAALVSAANWSAGGQFSLVSAIAAANYTNPIWQILGLASDPGQQIDVTLTLGAALTASGAITGNFQYVAIG